MTHRYLTSLGGPAIVIAVALLVPVPAASQTWTLPRTADGHPDLNGVWQSFTTANWDIQDHEAQPGPHPEIMATYGAAPAGQGIVAGNEIPYQPWALAKKKENFDKRMMVDVSRDDTWHDTGDPELKCYLPGVPRATYMPFPFQIVQGPGDFILIAYEYASATRTIRMNWKGEAPADSWMGQSYGKWEGDTLVVDVTGLDERTWLDRAGDFHSDALHVVERYTPQGPDILQYEATIEDPKVYSKPWKIRMPLYRHVEKDARLMEFKCVEFVEDLMYGEYNKKTKQ